MTRKLSRLWPSVALAAAALAIVPQPSTAQSVSADIPVAQANLGLRLLPLVASGKARNLLVSPASLAAVLAFLDTGATPGMHGAIAATLGLPPAEADAALDATRASAMSLAGLPKDAPLVFANAVFVDDDVRLKPDAVAKLEALGAEMASVDLGSPKGIASVNAWVNDKTAGLIPTILPGPLPDAALAALNALHFKDEWRFRFEAKGTFPAPFQAVGGKSADVPMMHLYSKNIAWRMDDKFVAIDLPYKAEGYDLIVVCSTGAPAGPEAYAGVGDWLAGEGFAPLLVNLSLPKFDAKFDGDLIASLDAIGLALGHSPSAFPKFSDLPLDLTNVIQKTLIKVDENGTEAAAATAGIISLTAAMPAKVEPVKIVIDKPFVFALREKKTGFVLLAGYIGDPVAN